MSSFRLLSLLSLANVRTSIQISRNTWNGSLRGVSTSTTAAGPQAAYALKPTISTKTKDEPTLSSLVGTVPNHTSYIVLHHPDPPSTYPSKLDSPLLRQLMLLGRMHGAIANIGWSDEEHWSMFQPNDIDSSAASDSHFAHSKERYNMTVYSSLHPWASYQVEGVNPTTIEASFDRWNQYSQDTKVPSSLYPSAPIDIFICTHAARDCRCGDVGTALADALRGELSRRRSEFNSMSGMDLEKYESDWSRWKLSNGTQAVGERVHVPIPPRNPNDIRIRELAHVGQHK